jgi:hypothetical protein
VRLVKVNRTRVSCKSVCISKQMVVFATASVHLTIGHASSSPVQSPSPQVLGGGVGMTLAGRKRAAKWIAAADQPPPARLKSFNLVPADSFAPTAGWPKSGIWKNQDGTRAAG